MSSASVQAVADNPVTSTAKGSIEPAWKDYQSVFTAAKAGMQGVDKEKVQRIVYEMSKVNNRPNEYW